MNVIVCGQFRDITYRRVEHCFNCDRRRVLACRYGGVWYGDSMICTACGERWEGWEHMPRPFRPRWRKDNIATAKRWLEVAIPVRKYRQFFNAEMRRSLK